MSINESRVAYEDCYEVMDKALESKNGVRVGFDNEGDAVFQRMRMNQARQLDRRFNSKRYSPDHIMHRKSEYDALTFRIRRSGDMFWVYAERKGMKGVVEEIKDKQPTHQKASYRRL